MRIAQITAHSQPPIVKRDKCDIKNHLFSARSDAFGVSLYKINVIETNISAITVSDKNRALHGMNGSGAGIGGGGLSPSNFLTGGGW